MNLLHDDVVERQRSKWRLDPTIALVVLFSALAILFGTADGTSETSRQGIRGIHAEAVLSAATAARNQVAQAQVLAVAEELGAATGIERAEGLRLVDESMSELETRLANLKGLVDADATIDSDWIRFSTVVRDILVSIRTGRLHESRTSIEGDLDPIYRSFVTNLAEYRDGQLLGLQLAQVNAGRVANAARFAVAFLIPLTFVVAFRRTTRRRQERLRLQQELETQRAVALAKDEAIANLSHELRTPLTSIYGFAMTMVEHPDTASEEIARLIASESADLSRMVDDLLTAAKSDNQALMFRQEIVDPVAEVKKVLDPLAHVTVVHTVLDEGRIAADRLRFRQVVRNLLSNAIKHGAAPMAVSGRVDGDSYVIEVVDSGPGVPQEIRSRIFERYVHRGQAPLLTGSVGLGLSIARLLSERMGGTLAYRRTVDLTVFELRLPLAPDFVASRPAEPFARAMSA